jgi:prepilin-type N-terminal cleavage/methylation domain-containing protein
MLKRARERASNESGISLVEVLVVIMIIGMIAAIGVPSFACEKTRAEDASSKAMARTAAAAMEAYAHDNLGAYDGANGTKLNAINSEIPSSMVVSTQANCSPDYCYRITTPPNPSTNNTFVLTKEGDGSLLSTCTTQGTGGCPSGGVWAAE